MDCDIDRRKVAEPEVNDRRRPWQPFDKFSAGLSLDRALSIHHAQPSRPRESHALGWQRRVIAGVPA
jgi:hypothetical protein